MTTTKTFRLPDLGEGLTEAEVVRWLVAVGDVVTVDAPVAEVETAKSLVEVPSPYAGLVETLHGQEGTTIAVGQPLITIATPATAEAETYRQEEEAGSGNVLVGYGTPESTTTHRTRRPRTAIPASHRPALGPGSDASLTPNPPAKPATPATHRADTSPTTPTPHPPAKPATPARHSGESRATSATTRPRVPLVISPLVRRLARDAEIDLKQLTGSGPDGLIVRRDVEQEIAARHEPQQPATNHTGLPELRRTPMTAFRKTVTATLTRSRAEIPEATTWVDVDATALVDLRSSLRTATDNGPGLLALMARFVVAGLQKYPELNGYVDGDELVQYDGVNLGLAAQTDRGLVVPAVPNAHTLTTRGLDAEIRRLTTSAREGKLSTHELTCGTFTLNNYGSFGVDGSAAIINHPQVAILGVGRIIDRPWVVDGELAIRKLTQLSLVFDHRVCDGGTAAGFLRFVADAFENPASAFADL
ncbi:pyruvate dehydrogenase E2 component (dihydrolipoamide acetyltransferase) [Kribbella amoyensis]|uniref:Dihydrolipoamide acetyltransferase component of pyruvate dehydrogenase complex n=1 Tax=Kribbella amoyensis TaxID=996641 RepID=A0A561BMC6_9ACTN|nr:dihydrolipoamide acetyltransferase family protein [Kribbella amoyensis]TWD79977.1 pyruvate dehydrogenase E2 component (dihydrolipoamide acetyltransferase) [Kribbella amoyensis]